MATCQQKKRVRFTTTAGLVNELGEAKHHYLLGHTVRHWSRYDLIVLNEVGYVPFAQVGAELFFQMISESAEQAMVIPMTNLPVNVSSNPKLSGFYSQLNFGLELTLTDDIRKTSTVCQSLRAPVSGGCPEY